MSKRQRKSTPADIRFWQYVDVKGDDECWEWKGSLTGTGYGVIGLGGRDQGKITAHRLSYMMFNGSIDKRDSYHGLVVMHKCDNKICVNPHHLKLGTQRENVKDMDSKGRRVNAQLKGSKHPNSKFTEDQVLEIRASTLNNAELGRVYGVPRQTIRYIRKGGWNHV